MVQDECIMLRAQRMFQLDGLYSMDNQHVRKAAHIHGLLLRYHYVYGCSQKIEGR